MLRTLFIGFFTVTGIATHAQYSSPESVEYDPVGNRYIVSSTNNGNLLAVQPGQAPTLFTADVGAPYGLVEYDGVVYVCDQGFVKGYSLSDAQPAFSLNLGGTFLNGICSDGIGHLFVTDFSAKKIYRVNIASTTFDVVVAATVNTPNGILFDAAHGCLVFCTWGNSAKLVAVDTATFTLTPKITTTLSNFDGVVQDGCGNFLVSEWGSNKIYKIDSAFGAPVAVFSVGISNPADIYFNPLNDTLAVPNTSANTVTFYKADFCTQDTVDYTSVAEADILPFRVISLPGELCLLWDAASHTSAAVQVSDMGGRVLERRQISGPGLAENTCRIDTQSWAPGMYVVTFAAGSRSVSQKVYVGQP